MKKLELLQPVVASKIQAIIEHVKLNPAKYILGTSTTAFVLIKIYKKSKSKKFPKPFPFPLLKDQNYDIVKKHKRNGTLPKIFNAQERVNFRYSYFQISKIFFTYSGLNFILVIYTSYFHSPTYSYVKSFLPTMN